MDKRRYARVLRDINALRAQYDLTPLEAIPSGEPQRAQYCPIACALHGIATSVIVGDVCLVDGDEVPLTPVLQRFIRDFDAGRIPELIAR